MINNINDIKKAYEKRDLSTLSSFAVPTKRELNKKQNYKSALMLSCNKIEHLLKIDSLEADCIVLNLEDGVSKEDKPFALILCAIFLSHHNKSQKKLVVRVNSLDNSGYDEITYLNKFMPDAIRVPKIKTKYDILVASKLLHQNIELHLSIETKEALLNLKDLKINNNIKAFYLGIYDLLNSMGLDKNIINPTNLTLNYILSSFLITSRAIGIKPISFVYQEHKNIEKFEQFLHLVKEMGYDCTGCISPTQATIANKIFSIDEDDLLKAKEIVKMFELNQKNGISGFDTKEYGFIDEPIYKNALLLLNKE